MKKPLTGVCLGGYSLPNWFSHLTYASGRFSNHFSELSSV
jgi:hypothetical protein